jgi:patatin-like phospholipase/acyl hydrolase
MKLQMHRNYRLPVSDAKNNALGYEDPRRILLWKAARCSSAAPTFFANVDGKFVDGGLIANNPTLDLLAEVQLHNSAAKYAVGTYLLHPDMRDFRIKSRTQWRSVACCLLARVKYRHKRWTVWTSVSRPMCSRCTHWLRPS